MPQRSEYSLNELGRATRGAAQGLMAKTNAYLGEWEACYQVSADLVSEGEYSFDEYGNIFTELGENGPGSIWEIQYMNASGGNWGQQLEGTFYQCLPTRTGPVQWLRLQPADAGPR